MAEKDDPRGWSHVRVATKYPHATRTFFEARGVQAECVKLNGAMELAPTLGLAPRIVDLVSSGRPLKDNGLGEGARSETRSVGHEWVRTGRRRGSPSPKK